MAREFTRGYQEALADIANKLVAEDTAPDAIAAVWGWLNDNTTDPQLRQALVHWRNNLNG